MGTVLLDKFRPALASLSSGASSPPSPAMPVGVPESELLNILGICVVKSSESVGPSTAPQTDHRLRFTCWSVSDREKLCSRHGYATSLLLLNGHVVSCDEFPHGCQVSQLQTILWSFVLRRGGSEDVSLKKRQPLRNDIRLDLCRKGVRVNTTKTKWMVQGTVSPLQLCQEVVQDDT